MRCKYAVCLLTIICLLLPAAGCWDSMDVNNKTLVVTVIADKKGDDYAFYIEAPNLDLNQNQKIGGNIDNTLGFQIIYAKGATYVEARRHLNSKVNNPIYLGTVKALVITDELAKHGIEEYMLRMQSDIQYRTALNVVTSFSDPKDIFTVNPSNSISIGEDIDDIIKSLKRLDKVKVYTVSDLLEFIYTDTSYVLINMDVENGILTYNGFCVFKDNQLIEFIPVEQSKGLVWILGDNIKRIYVVPFNNGQATIEVSLIKKDIIPIYENGELLFSLDFKFESKIMYLSKSILLDEQMKGTIKQNLIIMILQDISDALKQSKELKCDYLQLKEHFRIKYPNVLKNNNWEDIFINTSFNITVKSNLLMESMMDFDSSGRQR